MSSDFIRPATTTVFFNWRELEKRERSLAAEVPVTTTNVENSFLALKHIKTQSKPRHMIEKVPLVGDGLSSPSGSG